MCRFCAFVTFQYPRTHVLASEQAVEMAREGFGEDDPHMASACNNLAEFYRIRRQYDQAEPLYRQVSSRSGTAWWVWAPYRQVEMGAGTLHCCIMPAAGVQASMNSGFSRHQSWQCHACTHCMPLLSAPLHPHFAPPSAPGAGGADAGVRPARCPGGVCAAQPGWLLSVPGGRCCCIWGAAVAFAASRTHTHSIRGTAAVVFIVLRKHGAV